MGENQNGSVEKQVTFALNDQQASVIVNCLSFCAAGMMEDAPAQREIAPVMLGAFIRLGPAGVSDLLETLCAATQAVWPEHETIRVDQTNAGDSPFQGVQGGLVS